MKYIAAYLLLTIGGNASPSASDITDLLGTVDVSADSAAVEKVISELSGKDINTLIAEGSAKLASVPSGGGGGGGSAAPAAATGAAAPAAEEKKVEKEEEKEESDDDMGFGLFD